MLSTRVKLTAAFVAGLVAVTITLFLAVLAARNNAVYHDIALYAAAQGDLAARVITDAVQSKENVFCHERHRSHSATVAESRRQAPVGPWIHSSRGYGWARGLSVQ